MNLTMRSVYKDRHNYEILYDLMRARLSDGPDSNISHRSMPSYREHVDFVRSRPYRIWYVIRADGAPAGAIYASKLNEIGIAIFPDYRRAGVASWAIRRLIGRHTPLPAKPGLRSGRWLANINPSNEASIALFSNLGFSLKAQTYEHAPK